MSGYVKTFEVKEEDKDKSNKLNVFPYRRWETFEKIWSYLEYGWRLKT